MQNQLMILHIQQKNMMKVLYYLNNREKSMNSRSFFILISLSFQSIFNLDSKTYWKRTLSSKTSGITHSLTRFYSTNLFTKAWWYSSICRWYIPLYSILNQLFFFFSGYFTHPMLEKRIESLVKEQIETINTDIKLISEEIFQR